MVVVSHWLSCGAFLLAEFVAGLRGVGQPLPPGLQLRGGGARRHPLLASPLRFK